MHLYPRSCLLAVDLESTAHRIMSTTTLGSGPLPSAQPLIVGGVNNCVQPFGKRNQAAINSIDLEGACVFNARVAPPCMSIDELQRKTFSLYGCTISLLANSCFMSTLAVTETIGNPAKRIATNA